MTQRLTLYYAPDNASLCVRLLLGHLQMPYDTVLVDRRTNAQRSADYLRLNPNGLIPTLITPHGPIYETGAILLWLADQAPGTVFPAPDAADRGAALSHLFWLSNTLHAAARMVFYPDKYTDSDPEALRTKTRHRLKALFAQLEQHDLPAHVATQCYLAPLIRWCGLYGGDTTWFELSNYAVLHTFAKIFESSPIVHEVCALEGLGPTPFSAPQPPNPPEGSAT